MLNIKIMFGDRDIINIFMIYNKGLFGRIIFR